MLQVMVGTIPEQGKTCYLNALGYGWNSSTAGKNMLIIDRSVLLCREALCKLMDETVPPHHVTCYTLLN
jgi:hypothetical protein